MPFKRGDLNNPSFRQKRKKNRIVTQKSSGKPFSPRLRTTVLKRIASDIESNSVLAEAGIRDKNAAKRWKDMLEDKGNITPLKITPLNTTHPKKKFWRNSLKTTLTPALKI